MLSYQHAYHAGNFADVLKHVVLCLVIDYLKQKDKPFYFHDTHAGRGLYPFSLPEMEKIREHEQGIAKLWPLLVDPARCPPALQCYRHVLNRYNPGGTLNCYPGSGLFAHALMRADDQLLLTELHPAEFSALQQNARHLDNVRVQNIDAWQGLKGALPPKQSRGVILIDPSYELRHEHQMVIDGLADALRRFATGIYVVWYPVVSKDGTLELMPKKLMRGIEQLAPPSLLRIELCVAMEQNKNGLIGSGMLVINAPWQLDKAMKEILPLLHKTLATGSAASQRVQWLVGKT
jgi:23S rRNA (adenine2030-N6)-methyltransferase